MLTTVTDHAKWTITYSDGFVITNLGNSNASVNATLRRNGDVGWATYAPSTGNAPRLFKYQGNVAVTNYISAPITTTTVNINSACTDGEGMYYATYSNTRAWIVPNDLVVSEAYVEGKEIAFDEYATGATVPANTGVLIASDEPGTHTLTYSAEAGTSVLGELNCLRPTSDAGINAAIMTAMDAGKCYYRLTMHNGSTLGFWWGAADGEAFAVDANKAYLVADKTADARMGFLFGDESTGISLTTSPSTMGDGKVYNLNGQQVKSTKKGLYIKNGRKYILK